MIKFHERSIDSASLTAILREQLKLLVADEAITSDNDGKRTEIVKDVVNDEAKDAHKAQLQQLLEALEAEESLSVDDENESTKETEANDNENS